MSFIEKIKLLFKVKKPAGEIVDALQEAKKTKKWVHFTVTLLGILISTVAALAGVIPPQTQLIATTILQVIYNIVRGADKADNETIKGTLRTTEFYMTALTEMQKGIVMAQTGGINPEWFAMSSAIIGAALSFGQNLSARAPIQVEKVSTPEDKPTPPAQ